MILEEEARALGLTYVDSFPLLGGRWDAHLANQVKYHMDKHNVVHQDEPGAADCNHYCMHASVWLPVLMELFGHRRASHASAGHTSKPSRSTHKEPGVLSARGGLLGTLLDVVLH